MAKAKGWTNEQAQSALTEYGESLSAQSVAFRTQLEAHSEIGGTNLEAAQIQANRALDRFLPADSAEGKTFRSQMAKTGYGNWTPVVLLLARIGKAMGEDTPVGGLRAGDGGAKKSHAEVLFGGAAQS